jgi:hypothetical protein
MTIRGTIKNLKALFLSEEPTHLITQAGAIMGMLIVVMLLTSQDLPQGLASLVMVIAWLGLPWLYLDLRVSIYRRHPYCHGEAVARNLRRTDTRRRSQLALNALARKLRETDAS